MSSSSRPQGVLVASKALLQSSHCVLSRSRGVLGGVSWRLHDVFTALGVSWRLHDVFTALVHRSWCMYGVRTALPRHSGTALMTCRQNRNEFSLICTFALKKTPVLSQL